VNTSGVLYTAQAAGQQMLRFGNAGSIILIASMSGSITNRVSHDTIISRSEICHSYVTILQDHAWVSYNTSKSAVLQMARSMACELGTKNIRVNSLSPGHIYTRSVITQNDVYLLASWGCFFFRWEA
jgi:NAD(P)-dependent dehydrogenase (short-subunit alcohol dehydrogenase family)